MLVGRCWKGSDVSGLLVHVFLVRFTGLGLLGQVCWVRFAGHGFTRFGAGGGGVARWCLPGLVRWDLLGLLF